MITIIGIVLGLALGFLIGRNLKVIVYFDRIERLEREKNHWHEIACRQNNKPNGPPWPGGPE